MAPPLLAYLFSTFVYSLARLMWRTASFAWRNRLALWGPILYKSFLAATRSAGGRRMGAKNPLIFLQTFKRGKRASKALGIWNYTPGKGADEHITTARTASETWGLFG